MEVVLGPADCWRVSAAAEVISSAIELESCSEIAGGD